MEFIINIGSSFDLKVNTYGLSLREKADAATVFYRMGLHDKSEELLQSLKEHLVTTSEGMSLQNPSQGVVSAEEKMKSHIAVMESLRECKADNHAINTGMSQWLLSQKRVQDWGIAMTTVEAVRALMTVNSDVLDVSTDDEVKVISPRNKTIMRFSPCDDGSDGLGYNTVTINDALDEGVDRLVVKKKSSASSAWMGVYAQMCVPLTDITTASTGISVRCDSIGQNLKVGDRLTMRYVLTADRDYDYVCLKVGHAACLEPMSMLSGYRYANGLGYYMEMKDASTNCFFECLPEGVYVLEIPYYVERKGVYNMGAVKLNCVYAPEFSAHAGGGIINVQP